MDPYFYCRAFDIDEGLEILRRQRASLTPAQLVELCAFLRDGGVRTAEIAHILDCKNYQVSHWIRIGRQLHSEVKDLLHRGRISIGHCRVIVSLPLTDQVAAARNAIAKKQSVRELEKARSNIDSQLATGDLHYYERLSERIGEAIGHPVSIRPNLTNKRAGAITIQYADAEMFDAICDRLRINLQELV